ncbi:MAG: efflux RND transporter periplasmic adaptor subunit [Planctomycetes bacterium]|nr:efflux RND transporter periplasmic adaptor subunit [Planctomycetota bacterium]
MIHAHQWRLTAVLTAAALFVSGCSKPPAPPPPHMAEVTVVRPIQREVLEWDEYIGHMEAPETVNVTSRVSGFVMEAPFTEGVIVQKGDVLFVIDDRLFKATLGSARAEVAKAQSQADQAKVHLNRYASVRGTKAISDDDYDSAKAAYDQTLALLAAAKAAEETARLNLEWTRVTAPITGRISRKMVTVGNQINGGTGQTTVLTTLMSVDPMYCYAAVPARAQLKSPDLAIHKAGMRCFVQLENETGFPHEGVVDFLDNAVDSNTGTIQLRAVFPNPRGLFTPGLFARMRLPAGPKYQALLVPDVAVGSNQDERVLMIVADGDVVQARPVKLGPLFGSLRAIASGLEPNERVIVNGLQMAMPGMKVHPTEEPIRGVPSDLTSHETPATQETPASQPAPTETRH